jgi:hypothetical protein
MDQRCAVSTSIFLIRSQHHDSRSAWERRPIKIDRDGEEQKLATMIVRGSQLRLAMCRRMRVEEFFAEVINHTRASRKEDDDVYRANPPRTSGLS